MNELAKVRDHGRNHLVFFGNHMVKGIQRDGDLWFLASDLGRVLGLTSIRKNLRELKDSEKDWCYMEPKEPKWPTREKLDASYSGYNKNSGGGQVSEKLTPDPSENDKNVFGGVSFPDTNKTEDDKNMFVDVTKSYTTKTEDDKNRGVRCNQKLQLTHSDAFVDVTKSYTTKTEDDKNMFVDVSFPDTTKTRGGNRPHKIRVRVVNEAGLYRLVFMSRTPAARLFQDWVLEEVLPAIRKTGKYKLRKTTALAFMPEDMTGVQQQKIAIKERYRHLAWIEPAAV